MTVDLLHNKIVKAAITEGFTASINENLIPKLQSLYGSALDGIQMYEDYIKDEFIKDGYMYYPMTLNLGGVKATVWVKWDVSDKKCYKDSVPYSYIGEEALDFIIADDVPMAFKNAIANRNNASFDGVVKIDVSTDAPGATVLAGKYSQTFADEMARQLTKEISRLCGVRGLSASSIELVMVFAPNTYMEHTSENVTYRRLLISAKGCAPRDFWVKWTRLDSSAAFSVRDHVSADNIRFEIGEDVSHKIREKEYRFLVYGNSDKYRVAMGRKNITEWRELIKRALKRGELEKIHAEPEENVHMSEVSDKLSQILEKCGVSVPSVADTTVPTEADMANEALRMALLGTSEQTVQAGVGGYQESEPINEADEFDFDKEHEQFEFSVPDEDVENIADDMPNLSELLGDEIMSTLDEQANFEEEHDMPWYSDDEENSDGEYTEEAEESEDASEDEEIPEEVFEEASEETENEAQCAEFENTALEKLMLAKSEIERLTEEIANARRAIESERMEKEDAEARIEAEMGSCANLRAENEKQKVAIAELTAYVETLKNAHELSERELMKLRSENESLERENMRLVETAGELEASFREAELKRLECEQKLIAQNELYEKQKAREKFLVAEAARQARESMNSEALAFEEASYISSGGCDTVSDISEESSIAESKEARRAFAKEKAAELRRKMEEEARREADMRFGCSTPPATVAESEKYVSDEEPSEALDEQQETISYEEEKEINAPAPVNYHYVSKTLRIMFKNSIDQNMNMRIREMIAEALDKFGKSELYMKVLATIPDNNTVVLNFIEYPEEEMQLLVDIIHYLGNGDLGIYKVILE